VAQDTQAAAAQAAIGQDWPDAKEQSEIKRATEGLTEEVPPAHVYEDNSLPLKERNSGTLPRCPVATGPLLSASSTTDVLQEMNAHPALPPARMKGEPYREFRRRRASWPERVMPKVRPKLPGQKFSTSLSEIAAESVAKRG
jgi:hypothetical protein